MAEDLAAKQPGGALTRAERPHSRLHELSRRTFLAASTAVLLTRPVPAASVTPEHYGAGYRGGYR